MQSKFYPAAVAHRRQPASATGLDKAVLIQKTAELLRVRIQVLQLHLFFLFLNEIHCHYPGTRCSNNVSPPLL